MPRTLKRLRRRVEHRAAPLELHLKARAPTFSLASSLLETYQSPLVELRSKLHFEVARCELAMDYIAGRRGGREEPGHGLRRHRRRAGEKKLPEEPGGGRPY